MFANIFFLKVVTKVFYKAYARSAKISCKRSIYHFKRKKLVRCRRASSLQTCLSTVDKPATLLFDPTGSVRNETNRQETEMLTFRIYSNM